MSSHGQQKYQVRFDHGVAGAARIAPGAHVVVVVDVLDGHGTLTRDETARVVAALPEVASEADVVVVTGAGAASEVARHVVERQARRGDRALVAIVAAGAVEADGFRPAVEDQLAAGAVVDALAAVGIDFSSPEAALACAAAGALARASSHLLTASASAAELVATDRGDVVDAARASSSSAALAVVTTTGSRGEFTPSA
ncbi:hypothetical protein [Frigoribacterium sp. Leaf44]|uniref:hypothetical protein n=1 Tax=Frigoribacterium sp. Leaf44 TaxID=1736220 RepID=UPI0006F46EC2|nr:hypothetical protein [Frigoribacterium sp. Leaf44]KQN41346.1 hypothetical protein ASE87_10725 [Frigoribacterium sp. Leaf44]